MKVAISGDLLQQSVEGETVLLDLRGERYYSLDGVGTQIWTLLTEHGHIDAVCSYLRGIYDVDDDVLRRDVQRFVDGLAENGLITIVNEGSLADA
jgi:hypothetical protein